jgi:hypothetical protein
MDIFWFIVFLIVFSNVAKAIQKAKKDEDEAPAPQESLPTSPNLDELRRQIRARMTQRAGKSPAQASTPRRADSKPVVAANTQAPAQPREALSEDAAEGSYENLEDIPEKLQAAEARLKESEAALAAAEAKVAAAKPSAFPSATQVVFPKELSERTLLATRPGRRAAFVAAELYGSPKALR